MNTHQWRRGVDVAHYQRYQPFNTLALLCTLFTAGARRRQMPFKTQYAEVTPARGKVSIGNLYNFLETHNLILRPF